MGGGAVGKTRSTLDFARFRYYNLIGLIYRFGGFMKSFGKVKYRRYAFTLAEVLITITVIGVVAALTIPNLVNNYQNKAWSTASVVFQRKLGEALKVMNSQGTLAGYSSTEDFVNELSKHIKINKICKNDDLTSCFEDTIYWGTDNKEFNISNIKLATNMGQQGWYTETIGVQFADGVVGVIAYNPECSQDPYRTDVITVSDTGIGTDCLAIIYDTSGFRAPNTYNKDLMSINVDILNNTCVVEIPGGACFTSQISYKPLTNAECEAQKGDLGIPSCYPPGNDYWAGAYKTCKEMGSRLPTQAELNQIASIIYEGNTRIDSKAEAIGFTPGTYWANTTLNSNNAYGSAFDTNGVRSYPNRGNAQVKAMCLSQ